MKTFTLLLAMILPNITLAKAETHSLGESPQADHQASQFRQSGIASWYGPGFSGRRTASGGRFNPSLHTLAHRTLKLGTLVRVTNLRNHKSVIAKVTDRGPYHGGRIADLSTAAASAIGMKGSGTAPVLIVALS
jgi:rare lipoprotein A